MEKWEFFC